MPDRCDACLMPEGQPHEHWCPYTVEPSWYGDGEPPSSDEDSSLAENRYLEQHLGWRRDEL